MMAKTKFLDLSEGLGYLIGVLVCDFTKVMVLMVVFRQWRFVREECPKLQEVLSVEETVILLRHFPLFCMD
jgi:hypothetical protein